MGLLGDRSEVALAGLVIDRDHARQEDEIAGPDAGAVWQFKIARHVKHVVLWLYDFAFRRHVFSPVN
jgi:hypothetical protein